jgi:hypothetical protein
VSICRACRTNGCAGSNHSTGQTRDVSGTRFRFSGSVAVSSRVTIGFASRGCKTRGIAGCLARGVTSCKPGRSAELSEACCATRADWESEGVGE